MLNTKTFADILTEIHPETESFDTSEANWRSGWESVLDHPFMSQIMAETSQYAFKSHKNQRAYKTIHKKTEPNTAFKAQTETTTKTEAVTEPLRPLQRPMTDQQWSAFKTILQWSPALSPLFTKTELRSAYRQSMLKTHPDHGGSSESFHEAKKCYQILAALVK